MSRVMGSTRNIACGQNSVYKMVNMVYITDHFLEGFNQLFRIWFYSL